MLGITWHMLHDLDYQSYRSPKQDYVNLPLHSRTNSTRIRWWQPFVTDPDTGLGDYLLSYLSGSGETFKNCVHCIKLFVCTSYNLLEKHDDFYDFIALVVSCDMHIL